MMSKYKPFKKIVDKNGDETFAHIHDKKPMNRREFLATGLIPFAASLTLPSMLTILANSNVAEAQELLCPKGDSNAFIPIITLNLSGGAALSSNWVPMNAAGTPLASYNKMGLGPGGALPITQAMGANFAGNNISRLLVGIQNNAATAMLNTSFIGVPVRSRDDSNVNKFDITGLVSKAGYIGNFLPSLGNRNTDTGNKNQPAFVKPPTPLAVGSFNNIAGAIGVSGSLDKLSKTDKTKLFKMITNLSQSQSRKLASVNGGQELGKLVSCATDKNHEFSSKDVSIIDPTSNTAFSNIWGINANTSVNDQDRVFASMVYNGLLGNAGTINLEMGGYDYHNNTRTSGDTRDERAGDIIGRILSSAENLGKKVFLVVTSDGAVQSPVSESTAAPWRSDRGSAGCMYMMAYDPAKKPTVSGSQLGHFTEGQAADESFIAGSSPELAAVSVFANYLSFNGKADIFESVIPRVLSVEQLKSVIKIFKG